MTDLFTEIDEEVRRQKMQDWWKENGKFIIVGIILLVLSTAGWNFYHYWKAETQTEQTTALIIANEKARETNDITPLLETAETAKADFRMMALFQAANIARGNDDIEQMHLILDQIHDDRAVQPIYRHYARLIKLQNIAEQKDSDAEDFIGKLDDFIAQSNNPWVPFALELKAQKQAAKGDYAAAIATLDQIQNMVETPLELYGRTVKLKEYFNGMKQIATKK